MSRDYYPWLVHMGQGLSSLHIYEESCHRDYYPIWMSRDCYPHQWAMPHACIHMTHRAPQKAKKYTGWHRTIGCPIFIGRFLQKSPVISGSFANNDLQLGAPPPVVRPVILRVFAALYWQTWVCDLTQSCVRHDAFVYVTWLRRVWDVTHSSV